MNRNYLPPSLMTTPMLTAPPLPAHMSSVGVGGSGTLPLGGMPGLQPPGRPSALTPALGGFGLPSGLEQSSPPPPPPGSSLQPTSTQPNVPCTALQNVCSRRFARTSKLPTVQEIGKSIELRYIPTSSPINRDHTCRCPSTNHYARLFTRFLLIDVIFWCFIFIFSPNKRWLFHHHRIIPYGQ